VEKNEAAHRRSRSLPRMAIRSSFADHLMERLSVQCRENQRTDNKREEERRDRGAHRPKRDVVENVENPVLARQRKQEVIEHNKPSRRNRARRSAEGIATMFTA